MFGSPVAASLGFGGLDERIDRLDTIVGELGVERIEEAWSVLLKRFGYRFDRFQEERLGLRRALSAVEDLA